MGMPFAKCHNFLAEIWQAIWRGAKATANSYVKIASKHLIQRTLYDPIPSCFNYPPITYVDRCMNIVTRRPVGYGASQQIPITSSAEQNVS